MNWIKATIRPDEGRDIFFYDEDAGFLAGYLDEQGRFICRADGFEYNNVILWMYATLTPKLDVPAILADTLVNKTELAKRIWPGIVQPRFV